MATEYCYGCGGELILENAWMADGCPCNSPAGCNATNVGRWRLLERLQQEHQRDLSARGVQVNQLTANLEQVTAERDELREALAWVRRKLLAGDMLGAAVAIDRQLSAKGKVER